MVAMSTLASKKKCSNLEHLFLAIIVTFGIIFMTVLLKYLSHAESFSRQFKPQVLTPFNFRGRNKVNSSAQLASLHTTAAAVAINNKNKIHAVTYASHRGKDDRFCRAIESAIRNSIDLTILGKFTCYFTSQKLKSSSCSNIPLKFHYFF